MSDSQQFPVATHALAYMAHKGADAPARAGRALTTMSSS